MATDEEKREEVCKVLLSLLVSRQGATPVTVLDREYYDLEKERIPWRKFGHTDLIDFLKSAPQQFSVESYNGGHYVRGIAEKSRHVSSLVARQKSKPLSRMQRPRRPTMTRYIPQQRMRSKLPPNYLHHLVQYIRNYPDGVSMQRIREQIEQQLPSMIISLHDLRVQLYELSHQLRIDGEIIYPVQVNDTSRDAKNCKQSSPLMSLPQNALYSAPVEMCGGDEGPDFVEELDHDDYDFTDDETFIPAGCISKNPSKLSRLRQRFAMNFTQNAQFSEQNAKFYHDNNNDVDINTYSTYESDSINAETINDIEHEETLLISNRTQSRLRQLLEKRPEGIWCAELPDLYLKEYKVHLNYLELGFTSVRAYASYLKDIFYMTRKNTSDDFLLFSADKKPKVTEETIKPNPAEGEASSRERYDNYYGARAQLDDDNDDLPIPADVPSNITKRFAPENVMNYNDSVDCIRVTDLVARKRSLKAYVIEVFNPSFFWIQLWENKKVFESFMKDLTDFYKFNSDKYTIPKVALKKGLNCACIYANIWHRGIIKFVKPDFRVTVLFYDFGTLKTYAPEDVYYLHKRFSSLPAQAIPCCLYNIRPILTDRWKRSVNNQFIDRIDGQNGLLDVTIKSIDEVNNSMMVVLTDISEDGETDINEWLVKEKLAKRGKLTDAVDMASLMKYVNTNSNELPSYCFAEENLITDHCQTTSTEETHAVPLVSPKETLRDNNTQTPPVRSSVKPPPGFAPLSEHQPGLLKKSTSCNGSSGNTPNERTPTFGDATETTTNPFLYDQADVIPNDIAKSLFVQIWKENLQLQSKLTEMFGEMLEYTPLSRIVFDNHMKVQRQLNKILNSFEKAMTLNNERFVKTPFNLSKEATPNNVGSAQGTSINSNSEVFGNQGIANYANVYSPNVFNVDAQTCWTSPSDPFNPHVQVPLPTTTVVPTTAVPITAIPTTAVPITAIPTTAVPTTAVPTTAVPTTAVPITASSTFGNYQLSAGSLYSNANQENDLPSRLINSNLSNSDYASLDFLDYKNNEYASVIKETNPFKLYMSNNTGRPKTPESQQIASSYDSDSNYLSIRNLQNHISKIATSNIGANFHVVNNNSTSAGHVNVNGNETHYSSRIVYEAGPVMYNKQKQQASADSRQNSTCNSNLNVPANLGRDGTELLSLSVNNDILRNDEGYTTRSSTDCMTQGSSPMINEELTYYQQDQANLPRPVLARAWRQVEIPDHWINSKVQNSVSLQDSKEKCTAGTPVNSSPLQDWNYNNFRNSAFPNINGTIDTHAFNDNNKQNLMDVNMHLWNLFYNPVVNGNSIFVFQKIDSIENVSFIFHVDREGWMLVHEFVETFTNFKLCTTFVATLEMMNIKIAFKEIERSKYPVQFAQLDSFPLNVPRDSEKRITSISLISLQNVLSVLVKLKIVTREEVDNVLKSNEFQDDSILRKVWTLLFTYRKLKRCIEQYVNCRLLS